MANELPFSWQCKMDHLHDMKLHHSLHQVDRILPWSCFGHGLLQPAGGKTKLK
jgi:hypothetical protein